MRSLFFALALVWTLPSYAPNEYEIPRVPMSLQDPGVEMHSGLRPYRNGGFRAEHESIFEIDVVHLYGTGGAGLTLAEGLTQEGLLLARPFLQRPRVVYVIGAGVMGLSIANALGKAGHTVHILAKDFLPNIVSARAGGLVSPVSVDLRDVRSQRIQRASFQYFRELEAAGWPVEAMPLFVTQEARDSGKSGVETFEAFPDLFEVRHYERFPHASVGGYGVHDTWLIDTPLFMKRLEAETLALPNVTRAKAEFYSMEEVAQRVGKGALVFHASGLGARELANDPNVVPVHGDLVYRVRPPGELRIGKPNMTFYGAEGNRYAFLRAGEEVYGGSFKMGDGSTVPDEIECAGILAETKELYGVGIAN